MANRGSEQEKLSRLDPIPRPRLHNFSFLTSSWGAQRVMRRVESRPVFAGGSRDKLPEDASDKGKSPAESPEKEKSPEESSHKKKKKKKLLNESPDKEKSPEESSEKKKNLLNESSEKGKSPEEEESEKEKSPENVDNLEIPWNLRKRRAYGKGDSSNGVANGAKEGKRKPFSLSLSYEEVEADFLIMKGKKPPRRPKKRPKHVQKQIDMLFPGMWLSEVTPDLYKVKED